MCYTIPMDATACAALDYPRVRDIIAGFCVTPEGAAALGERVPFGSREGPRIEALKAEMIDRFGPPPDEAQALSAMMEIKLWLKKVGVQRLETGAGGLTLTFGPAGPANYDRVMALVLDKTRKVRLSPNGRLFVGDIRLQTGRDLEKVKNFLPGLI